MKNYTHVTASELGEFVYCKRAWWQKFNEYTKENAQMVQGTKAHNLFYKIVKKYGMLQGIIYILLFISLIILFILGITSYFLGL